MNFKSKAGRRQLLFLGMRLGGREEQSQIGWLWMQELMRIGRVFEKTLSHFC